MQKSSSVVFAASVVVRINSNCSPSAGRVAPSRSVPPLSYAPRTLPHPSAPRPHPFLPGSIMGGKTKAAAITKKAVAQRKRERAEAKKVKAFACARGAGGALSCRAGPLAAKRRQPDGEPLLGARKGMCTMCCTRPCDTHALNAPSCFAPTSSRTGSRARSSRGTAGTTILASGADPDAGQRERRDQCMDQCQSSVR